MKNTEARTILGLDPDDDPRAFLPAFEETRQFKQELVNNAPNDEIKFRYQQELLEYEAAVKVVVGRQKARPHTDFIIVLLLIAAVSAVAWWGYQWYQKEWNEHARIQVEIANLKSKGRIAVVGRKWQVAEEIYQEIEALDPGSATAAAGFESIRRGKAAEQSQQMFYTLGESQAALEAGRWDEAEKLARQVLEIDPDNKTAKRKLEMIAKGKRKQEIAIRMLAVTESLEQGDLPAAREALNNLRTKDPENPNLSLFIERINAAEEKTRQRQQQALKLFAEAQKLDTGEYSRKAIDLLDEARLLYPTHKGILALHKKMGAYTRALHVPVDYPTIAEAVSSARAGDLIRVAPGVYQEALVLDKPVRIEGAAEGKTIIELKGKEDSIITIAPEAKGTNLTSLSLRHSGYDHGKDRFSVITVMAPGTTIRGCTIKNAAGHGIAVVQGGQANIIGCSITQCGWDGVSVYGKSSHANIRDSRMINNLHHGVNFWNGGSGEITNSFLLRNSLCGFIAMSKGTEVAISSCTSSDNRDAGIMISGGVKATLTSNKCEKNLLSGIVVQGKGTQVGLTGNLTKGNHQVGILIYENVTISEFNKNTSTGNIKRQLWRDATLKQPPPKKNE